MYNSNKRRQTYVEVLSEVDNRQNRKGEKGGTSMMLIGIIIWVFGMCLSQATGHGD